MVTTLNFKNIVDLPKWRTLAPIMHSFTSLISDLRNNEDRDPYIYGFITSTFGLKYNVKSDGWQGISGYAPEICSDGVMMPAQGPRGIIAAGATTISIPLTTALPAVVAPNQLANRGDERGFKIRIIGNSAGSSGKTEERLVIANTGETTTPTIILDSPLSFVPANGDTYEFLSGRIFISNRIYTSWLYLDILTNSFLGPLTVTPTTFSQPSFIGLDELYVPYDRNPGEGFFGTLTATASGAASLTGQAAGGDAGIVVDQYRNFQIRIIEDTAIPTAVGQRRNIDTHTGGPNPVYTVSAWTVTPSINAQYVIENNGDRIIAWTSTDTNTYTYSISGDVWDTNITFAARTSAPDSGFFSAQSFSIKLDTSSPPNSRHSYVYSFRGGFQPILDLFDIAGAATGVWTDNIIYGGNFGVYTFNVNTNTSSVSDPKTMEGKYIYIYPSSPFDTPIIRQSFYRFDMKNRVLEPYTTIRVPSSHSATSTIAKTLAITHFQDGATKLSFLIFQFSGIQLTGIIPIYSLPITR
jgi:hypothetical protein